MTTPQAMKLAPAYDDLEEWGAVPAEELTLDVEVEEPTAVHWLPLASRYLRP